ncbi:MAG: Y-family DNA polymerase [Pseudomonas sp.]
MNPSVFALVDCNNFYASCERLFRPDLQRKPIVILSNNDGCIISRSNEAKALGVAMGAPFHQVERELRALGVQVFSSNYALYGELSRRVMETLEDWSPALEVYSIDEAFLDLAAFSSIDLPAQAQRMRGRLLRELGMPCGIGLAPTKTLAKLANRAAKFDARSPAVQRQLLRDSPIEAVWGVGLRLGSKLKAQGLRTAQDLARADPQWLRQEFNVTLERTALELRGLSRIELDQLADRQMILSSRSFGRPVRSLDELRQALALYVARAAEKLRSQSHRCYCRTVAVSISTGVHSAGSRHFAPRAFIPLATPSQDTRDLSAAALKGLRQIYRPGHDYAKASVQLLDLLAPGEIQYGLFEPGPRAQSEPLMRLLDQLNSSGQQRLGFASALNRAWGMRHASRSPAYTSDWNQLWQVKSG